MKCACLQRMSLERQQENSSTISFYSSLSIRLSLYVKLSSGIPTIHILFIYNVIVYNQERTLVESYNFSIKENLKKVFDILSRKNIQCRVRTSNCLKLCMLCRFPSKIVRGSYNGRTVVRDIVS